MTVHVHTTEVTVCALPFDDDEASAWAIKVALRSVGRYAVVHHASVLTIDGVWEYEPQPSSRDDAFLQRARFDYDTAMQLAVEWAPRVRVNGMTAAEVLRWRAERRAE